MLVPKLRFKREDGTEYPEWRYARTDEIAEINPKTSDLPNRFYYMDLGSVSRGAWQEKTITDKDNAPSRANRLASVGDVFFQSVRPYNMGHFFFEEEYEYPVVASTGFIQLRTTQEYYNGFIYQLLYEDRFNAEVNIRCTGSNYPAINSENFSDIEMLFPCLEEQQKIADFLSTVDEVIAQSEAEVQNLEQQKKAAMQKIFSQEVRFKREDGSEYPEWKNDALCNISKIRKGKQLDKSGIKVNGIYYHLNGGIEPSNRTDLYNSEANTISISEGGNSCGFVRWNSEPFFSGGHNYTLQDIKEYIVPLYLFQYLKNNQKSIMELRVGTGLPNIQIASLSYIDIALPCLEEQQKIADFLSAYDEAISYAKQELEHWKQLKKGLLQQMFV